MTSETSSIVHTPLSVQLTQCTHKLLGELVSGAAEKVIGIEAGDGDVLSEPTPREQLLATDTNVHQSQLCDTDTVN